VELQHQFTVPTGVEETWSHFQDIASVAECFPGATVSSFEADSFSGSVKVKLGPIALLYNGSGTFLEKDEAAHRFVVEAKGKDKRGNGTAGATVTLSMAEADGGSATDVEVLTDLSITGKPAQFGRGVMQDVSDKLLGQFVACLESRLGGGPLEEAPAPEAAAPPVSPVAGGATPGETPAAEAPPAGGPATPPPAPTPRPAPVSAAPRHAAQDDALDLGATVLPILVKTYWKQGAVMLAVLAFVWWVVSRRD